MFYFFLVDWYCKSDNLREYTTGFDRILPELGSDGG